MGIKLNEQIIDDNLPKVSSGLTKYSWLQRELHQRDVSTDREYQKRFNGFYRVRRAPEWQAVFFKILERDKKSAPSLTGTLRELHKRTRRVEASFASKLVATIAPENPVIDSVVLKNLGLALRSTGDVARRIQHIADLHAAMAARFSEFLDGPAGRYLVRRFGEEYPSERVTPVKMLDLVLWQTRPAT